MINSNMKISQNGVDLIKRFEGVRLQAYWDYYGSVWTIGYGHTKGVYSGMVITQQQAEQFLFDDIESHVFRMKQLITRKLTQNQFDSLASFHFNLGAYILDNDQVLLRNINNNDTTATVNHMMQYCYSGGIWLQGLWNRRKAETDLYKTGDTITTPENSNGGINMKQFILGSDVWLRKGPSTKSASIGSQPLKKGSRVDFNDIVLAEGYMWGVQPRADKSKGYIALGKIDSYGSIK